MNFIFVGVVGFSLFQDFFLHPSQNTGKDRQQRPYLNRAFCGAFPFPSVYIYKKEIRAWEVGLIAISEKRNLQSSLYKVCDHRLQRSDKKHRA